MRPTEDIGTKLQTAMALAACNLLAALLLAQPVAGQEMTDQGIADAVQDELLFDPAVPVNEIDVEVDAGVVTLRGTVSNILAKDRATRIAETVKGVKSVVNLVDVEPAETRSDSAVEQEVSQALLRDPATESFEIEETVEDGEVTLTGVVNSAAEKRLAEKVAKGVRGVTAVKNDIQVEYEEDRSDAEIRPEVEQALRWDALVDHALIDVSVEDGVVTLTGTVGSAAEKRQARYDAWVAGVMSVDVSGLEVARWARDEDLRKEKYKDLSAEDIEQAVKDGLLYDPRVMAFNVTPEVVGTTVTLRGTVPNLKAKRAAEQVARSTVGVSDVTNRLKVRPEQDIQGAEVAEDVRSALLRDPYVDSYEVDVNVENGTVYLSGKVDSYFEKWQADDVASKVEGVTEVRNNLAPEETGPLAYDPYTYEEYPYDYDWYDYEPYYTFTGDREIKEEIIDELWWSPFVDQDEVTVRVEDGVATLTGTVDSWSEFNAATENAYEGGAVWVDNELEVQ